MFMKKIQIITARKQAETSVKRMMICSARKKNRHCLTECFHGIPHEKERERDACHLSQEICKIQKGIIKVTCRHLNAKEKKEWITKELNNESQ